MKSIFYILPLVALCSNCAKKTPVDPIVVIQAPSKPLTAAQSKALRHPESVRKYAIGRYTDPNNQNILHEAHVIYRVEATSKWNHLPNRAKSLDRQYPKHFVKSQESKEIATLRQNLANERKTNRAVMVANKKLQESITPLTESFNHTKVLAEQNAELRRQLHAKKSKVSSKVSSKKKPSDSKPASSSQSKSNLLEWFDSTNKQ